MLERGVARVLVEAAVVGLSTFAVSYGLFFSFNGYLPTPRADPMFASWFLVGLIVHIAFEVLGLNERWCTSVYQNYSGSGYSGPLATF